MFDVTPEPAGLEAVRFIAADMDGTLLTPESELPEGFEAYLDALADVGCEFAIASGRPIHNLMYKMGDLASKLTLISDNGATIARYGEVIYQAKIDVDDYRAIARLTHKQNDIGIICGIDNGFFEDNSKPYEDYFRNFYTNIEYVDSLEDVDANAVKYSVYYPDLDAPAHGQSYIQAFGDKFAVTYGGHMWLDIQLAGVSKGSAMKKISDITGIGINEMAAFGDALNDAEMLSTVGFSYMMANADPEMVDFAQYVAPSNAECGVLQVLDQIIAARKEAGCGR